MARELKPVSFNPDTKADREILEYIEELGVSFGSYVKLLIRKDMRAGGSTVSETNDTAEIASQLKELVSIFKTGNISIGNTGSNETDNETAITVEELEETEEEKAQRLAMQNLLGMGGK
jgi:hypothetical protein